MPSKSKKQHNLMAAVANNPQFAKKVGIPQSVGKEYVTGVLFEVALKAAWYDEVPRHGQNEARRL